ncbi:MAG: Gfo/Idh/MocA family oxidoreductase [Sedimentisphaerales bacterium]|nr:Gfo/Idh/MocA family oxidoreductase [Sedimentisphaerales bacterium]
MENKAKVGSDGELSRRDFMGAAAAVAAFTIVPRRVLGGAGNTPPSGKLNIAGVGVGGMGQNNVARCAEAGENIVALCDVDTKYSAEVFKRYPKARQWTDFRKMLDEQKDIDAVVVATPDHLHAVVTMAAMQRGKHVYVQKPLTRTVWEARMLTEAARKYKVATQMGNQGHSSEEVRLVNEWIQDGAIGNVTEVHCWTNRPVWPQGIDRPKDAPPVPETLDWDLWIGPSPMRPYNPIYLPFNWRAWIDFGAGALGDMGCHVMDAAFSSLKLKYPVSVQASHSWEVKQMWTRFDNKETYPSAEVVHYQFPARGNMPPVKLHWYDGGILPQRPDDLEPGRRIPESGTIFVGDKAKLVCDTYSENPRIFPESKMRAYKRPAKTLRRVEGGVDGHERDWISACKGGPAASSNFDYSGPFTETVVMGNLAVLNPDKVLEWDGENMRMTNDEGANSYVRPEYREGWSL